MATITFAYVSALVAATVAMTGWRLVAFASATLLLAVIGVAGFALMLARDPFGVELFLTFLLGALVAAIATLVVKSK